MGQKSVPLYEKVKTALSADIRTGKYSPGGKIPTEPELEKIYGASRITIRRAVTELCQEGILNKQQGSGTFVSEPLLHRCIVGGKVFEGFTQTCLSNGAKPGARVIKCELVPSSEAESKCLKLSEGAVLLHIQRVRTANEVPIYMENIYLPYDGFGSLLDMDLNNTSLFRAMEKAGGRSPAGVAYRSIAMAKADAYQAAELGIAIGEPMFFMKVIYNDAEGEPLCIGRQYYIGTRYIFESFDGIILDNIPTNSL